MVRTVADVLRSDVVSTAELKGLNDQLVSAATKLGLPLVNVEHSQLIRNDNAVNLAFAPKLVPDLLAVLKRFGGRIRVNSAYRTVAQQFLLFKWHQEGLISLAARPGTSNHEGGTAIDVQNWEETRDEFKALGWTHQLDKTGNDPYHFDKGSGDRTIGVRAMQSLWNAHNPTDKIAVDGAFGRQSEARLLRMPIDGYS